MCQIIYKPRHAQWDMEKIHYSHILHQHGAGIAYHNGSCVVVKKGLWGMRQIREVCAEASEHDAVLHLRLASSGAVTTGNCHPFVLPDGSVLFHNGHLFGLGDGEVSDTREFVEYVASPLVERRELAKLIQWLPYVSPPDKWVIIAADGQVHLIGSDRDAWIDGCWYSTPEEYLRRGHRPHCIR